MAPSAMIDGPVPAQSGDSAVADDHDDASVARILVAEKVSPDGLALLTATQKSGRTYQVDTRLGLSPADLLAAIPAYHALIVRSETKVTASVLAAGRKLRVVARAGVGVDNIDVDAATAHGIVVVNSPAGNIRAAAEHTIALLMATARNIGQADASLKSETWQRSRLVGVEVGGKTLGIIGLGKVGMQVARMAKGLGMRVVALDPYASAEVARKAGVELLTPPPAATALPTPTAAAAASPGDSDDPLDRLLPQVDFLTIHTPLLATTLNLLAEPQLRRMKPTARVLNVARGGVYNEAALVRALDAGWIAGAGIDVFSEEPLQPGSDAAKLAAHPRVVATPHLGASTVEAQENVSLDVCAQVATILAGGLPTAAVNAPLILPDEYRTLQPYVRLVERMGSLYTQHFSRRPHGLRRRFELVYQGELAAVSNTRPLLAALVKGLVSPISDAGGRDVNIVNATLIATEKGLAIRETHERSGADVGGDEALGMAAVSGGVTGAAGVASVTLRAQGGGGGGDTDTDDGPDEVIEGYVSGQSIFISRVDRFVANFTPAGTMLVMHNYDEPGKIGHVGMVLGAHRINITFMHVASLDRTVTGVSRRRSSATGTANEALMILGVSGPAVTPAVLEDLRKSEGILDVSLVRL